jgi:hypothetical protein
MPHGLEPHLDPGPLGRDEGPYDEILNAIDAFEEEALGLLNRLWRERFPKLDVPQWDLDLERIRDDVTA